MDGKTIAVWALVVVFMATPGLLLALWGVVIPRRDGRRWAESAAKLGLELEPWAPSHRLHWVSSPPTIRQVMSGRRGRFDVRCGVKVTTRTHSEGSSTSYVTYVELRLPRSLALGLYIHPLDLLARIWEAVVGEDDMQVADPRVDPYFEIRADRPTQAQALVHDDELGEALAARAKAEFRPAINDEWIRCQRSGKHLDAETLAAALDDAVELAEVVLAAHARRVQQPSASAGV